MEGVQLVQGRSFPQTNIRIVWQCEGALASSSGKASGGGEQ